MKFYVHIFCLFVYVLWTSVGLIKKKIHQRDFSNPTWEWKKSHSELKYIQFYVFMSSKWPSYEVLISNVKRIYELQVEE